MLVNRNVTRAIYAAMSLLLAVRSSASVESEDVEIKTAARAFIETFNRNDMQAMAAMFTPEAVIVDDIPPYVWQGRGACARFGHAWVQH